MFGALILGFMGTQNVQADGIFTGTLSSSTITAGTSSISISGVDSFDPTGTQVAVLLFTGACPHSGTAIFGPVWTTTVSGGGYTQNIPTSSLSPGSYCVHAGSTHTQVSVDDPLQVAPWLFIETTTIVDLHYPSQVVLQNGVAQATITFTLSYSGLPPGDAILFGIYLNSGNPTLLDGSGASTPDACTSSWGGQSWPGKAACAVAPSSSSGTESATLTITSAASPQQYSLFVGAIMVNPSSKAISSSMSKQTFTLTVVAPSTPATDWAVLSVSLSSPNPNVGDLVTFSMVVTALSSQASFPQNFAAVCQIDGVSCGGGTLTYPGPLGTPMTVSTQTPWTATAGTHTLTWAVATIPVGQDPDKSNNAMSKTFTVAPQVSTSTATTPEYQNYALPFIASFALVIIMLPKKRGGRHANK